MRLIIFLSLSVFVHWPCNGEPYSNPYNIWPKVATNKTGNIAIHNRLKTWLTNESAITTSQIGGDLSSVNYWFVTLTGNQVTQSEALDNVAVVSSPDNGGFVESDAFTSLPSKTFTEPPTIRARANDPGLTTQFNSVQELVVISQPQYEFGGSPLPSLAEQYVYDQSAGEGATVYLIDTGADPENQEFVDLQHSWRWSGPNYRQNSSGDYVDPPQIGDWPDGHGTAMLSKIGGRLLGVSKKVQSVIARIPDIATTVDMLDAITWVIDDWKKSRDRQSVKVAIINISYNNYVGPHFKTPDPIGLAVYLRFQDLLNYAIEQGLLPICSAGNKPGPFGGFPAMFAGLNNWNPFINEGADFIWPPVPELLVVGATDGYGKLWNKSSTGHFVALNAPGVGVWTAVLGGKYTRISGTSTAAATVSGIAAYYAALPSFRLRWNADTTWHQRVIDLKRKLVVTSYSRRKGQQGYPNVVWNGITQVGDVCGTVPPPYRKRNVGEYCNSTNGSSVATVSSISTVSSSSDATSISATTSSGSATSSIPAMPVQRRTNVQVSHNSVLIGDLNGQELYDMVVSRLTDQCPAAFGPNATCDSSPGAATIEDVGFVSHRDLETGNLEFTINNSNYSTTAERDSMIALVASSMESSSPRSNCTEEGYEEGCSLKSGIIDTAPEKCKKGTVTVCTATDGVNVEITEGDDGVVAFMDVAVKFDVPAEDYLCNDLAVIIQSAFNAIPELRLYEKELGSITAACEVIEENTQGSPGGASPPP